MRGKKKSVEHKAAISKATKRRYKRPGEKEKTIAAVKKAFKKMRAGKMSKAQERRHKLEALQQKEL